MLPLKKTKRMLLILLMCIVIYGVMHGPTFYSNQTAFTILTTRITTTSHQVDTERGPLCLHVEPAVRKDEFPLATENERIKRICPGDYSTKSAWRVNYNVERWYRFHPTDFVEIPKSMPSLMERIQTYIFHNDIPIPKRNATIPKIFHFIWTDEMIPTDFNDNLKLFRKTHPSWAIHFWTLRAGRTFIQKYEPTIVKIYDRLENVFKADALRYVLMYHIGGAYFDLDSKVIKPIDELAESYECVIGPEPIENAVSILRMRSLLANSGLLCMPGHAFYRSVIDLIPVHGKVQPGPVFFSKCFNIFLDQQLINKTASRERFDLKMVSHDYFEYTVNSGDDVDGRMKQICSNYTTHAHRYLSECLDAYNKRYYYDNLYNECENMYDTMYLQIPHGTKMKFDACVEWISHGESNRKTSTNRFIEHVHYGTHRKHVIEKMDLTKNNPISEILPGISIHR